MNTFIDYKKRTQVRLKRSNEKYAAIQRSKDMAKKQETGKALVNWSEEFAGLAEQSAKGAKVSEGKFISFSSGKMSFAGADIPSGELRCVVVGWIYANAYYDPDVPYDSKNPQSPICFAFSKSPDNDTDEMVPHDESPNKQADGCAGCPHNEFGSAVDAKGRPLKGKACKNMVRLALIAESDLEDIENAEVVYASLPPMSIKNWEVYAKKTCAKGLKRPHWSVITTMARVADAGSQFRVTFEMEEVIEDSDLFGPLKELWMSQADTIDFPYQVREAAPVIAKKPAKAQKFARR